MTRSLIRTVALVTAVGLLAGCAALQTLDADVTSHSQWPAGRAPGTYAFERLPSQQAQPDQQAQLESAAQPALAKAGFTPAADATKADVTVQLALRVGRSAPSPWDDPAWRLGIGWGWPYGPYGRYPYWGLGASWRLGGPTTYDREVAVLIRDRAAGTPLYESRARSEGITAGSHDIFVGMFDAALMDFPKPAVNPRRVTVPLARTPPAQ